MHHITEMPLQKQAQNISFNAESKPKTKLVCQWIYTHQSYPKLVAKWQGKRVSNAIDKKGLRNQEEGKKIKRRACKNHS
jgi:hypothetical protein